MSKKITITLSSDHSLSKYKITIMGIIKDRRYSGEFRVIRSTIVEVLHVEQIFERFNQEKIVDMLKEDYRNKMCKNSTSKGSIKIDESSTVISNVTIVKFSFEKIVVI